MKCPRCQAEMKRMKLKENTFQYRCPKCNKIISNTNREDKNEYKDAYELIMGKAEN